jgi:hypothetical protein
MSELYYEGDLYDRLEQASGSEEYGEYPDSDDSEKEFEDIDEPESEDEEPEKGESYISSRLEDVGYSDRQGYTTGRNVSTISTIGGGERLNKFQQRLNLINMPSKERVDMILEIECQRLGYSQDVIRNVIDTSMRDTLRAYRNPSLYCIVIRAFVQELNPKHRQGSPFLSNLYLKASSFTPIDVYRYKMLIEGLY